MKYNVYKFTKPYINAKKKIGNDKIHDRKNFTLILSQFK